MFSNCELQVRVVLPEHAEAALPVVRQVGVERCVVQRGHHLGHGLSWRPGPVITAVQVSFWPGSSFETKCSQLTVSCLLVHGTSTCRECR